MILVLVALLGCKPAPEEEILDYTIDGGVLSGQIGGEDWLFVQGHTNSFLDDEDRFFATLYSEAFEACSFDRPDGNSLILNIPTEEGFDDNLSLGLNMTFVVEEDDGPVNLIGTEGRLLVETITETEVSGGITAVYDDDNEVSGTFTVTICTDE